MKLSRRAKRMQRQHTRRRPFAGFNLVALMDIFTILVFFLLVNAGEVQTLPTTQGLKLPESIARKPPAETLVIMVDDENILVRGKRVVAVAEVIDATAPVIDALKAELERLTQEADTQRTPVPREITIMGDKEIPFRLLKKVMVTCTRAKYTKISLAVLEKAKARKDG